MNIIGSRIIELDQTFSTNEFASSLLQISKQVDGTIVLADYQSNGKGQGNNIWISEKGKNLLFSIIIFPDFLSPDKQFFLSMAVCLSLIDTIYEFTNGVCEIKWPNDILFNNKKVAGILINNTLSKNKIKHSIVGIGLNVNQKEFSENLPNASSLCKESEIEFDKDQVFKSLIKNLNKYYYSLSLASLTQLKSKYLSNLYKNNELCFFSMKNGKRTKGIIKGIEDSGKLVVDFNNILNSYYHGELSIEL